MDQRDREREQKLLSVAAAFMEGTSPLVKGGHYINTGNIHLSITRPRESIIPYTRGYILLTLSFIYVHVIPIISSLQMVAAVSEPFL